MARRSKRCSQGSSFHSGLGTRSKTECYEILRVAVSNVISDEGFSLPCEKALRARLCAEKLLEWMPDNKETAANFSFALVTKLNTCCSHQRQVTPRTHRQRLWEKYYKYCSSAELKEAWCNFLRTSIGFVACPIFYQFVTKVVLEAVINQVFSAPSHGETMEQEVLALGYEESNALRYTCGYVIRSLIKKLKRSANPMKKELILCLEDMKEKAGGGDNSDSEDWTNELDRGGLIHVTNETNMLFVSMEMELRKHLTTTTTGKKEELIGEIISNDEVQYHWSILANNWDEEADQLIKLIVEHWITIRGFSFVSAFLELYKQQNKCTIDKSKALRKKLTTDNTLSIEDN